MKLSILSVRKKKLFTKLASNSWNFLNILFVNFISVHKTDFFLMNKKIYIIKFFLSTSVCIYKF